MITWLRILSICIFVIGSFGIQQSSLAREHRNYLKLSTESLEARMEWLKTASEEERLDQESQDGFVSLETARPQDNQRSREGPLASPLLRALLNSEGFIQIDDLVYRVDEHDVTVFDVNRLQAMPEHARLGVYPIIGGTETSSPAASTLKCESFYWNLYFYAYWGGTVTNTVATTLKISGAYSFADEDKSISTPLKSCNTAKSCSSTYEDMIGFGIPDYIDGVWTWGSTSPSTSTCSAFLNPMI